MVVDIYTLEIDQNGINGAILVQVSRISGIHSKDVILWGFSMGGAISAAVAVQRPVNTLILQFPPDR